MEDPFLGPFDGPLEVRGEHFVLSVVPSGQLGAPEAGIEILLEDVNTADQWAAEFTAGYIEELTTKTGSFKSFPVFLRMLYNALGLYHTTISHDEGGGVTLDLLSPEDLEMLRRRRTGGRGKPVHNSSAASATAPAQQQRRYLIVTYTSDYDRVHYPLPLSYYGQPDPAALRRQIRDLQDMHGTQGVTNDQRTQTQLEKLRADNQRLHARVESLQAELKTELGDSAAHKSASTERLRMRIQNLEVELRTERMRHKKTLSAAKVEREKLMRKIEELRASERDLRAELRSRTRSTRTGARASPGPYSRYASGTPPRSSGYGTSRSVNNSYTSTARSGQSTPQRSGRNASAGYSSSYGSSVGATMTKRAVSASPGRRQSSGFKRFDPTAWAEEAKMKRELARQRVAERSRPPSASSMNRSYGSSRGPSPVPRRTTSLPSSASYNRTGRPPSASSTPPRGSTRGQYQNRALNRSVEEKRSKARQASPIPPRTEPASAGLQGTAERVFQDVTMEMSEIDKRLDALSAYLKRQR
eukprot:Clim_evm10s21 gene=Clim_evmTU10s21